MADVHVAAAARSDRPARCRWPLAEMASANQRAADTQVRAASARAPSGPSMFALEDVAAPFRFSVGVAVRTHRACICVTLGSEILYALKYCYLHVSLLRHACRTRYSVLGPGSCEAVTLLSSRATPSHNDRPLNLECFQATNKIAGLKIGSTTPVERCMHHSKAFPCWKPPSGTAKGQMNTSLHVMNVSSSVC